MLNEKRFALIYNVETKTVVAKRYKNIDYAKKIAKQLAESTKQTHVVLLSIAEYEVNMNYLKYEDIRKIPF